MSNKIENLDSFKEKVSSLSKTLLKGTATIAIVSSLALTMGMGQAMANASMPSVSYEGSSIINPTDQQVQDAHSKFDAYKNKNSESDEYTTISGHKSKMSLEEYKELKRQESEAKKLEAEKKLNDYKNQNRSDSVDNYEKSKSGLLKEMENYGNETSGSFDDYKKKTSNSFDSYKKKKL